MSRPRWPWASWACRRRSRTSGTRRVSFRPPTCGASGPAAGPGHGALNAFIASFAIGVGGTGWLIQGESFPTAVRGQAAAIAASVDWAANFALIEAFPTWQTGIGLGWIMICFAAISVIAIAFVYRFLPETKNRSVEEITQVFERQASGDRSAGIMPAKGSDATAA